MALSIVQGLLAVIFTLTGVPKVVGTRYMVRAFDKFGYPQWLRVTAGLIEVVAAAALVLGYRAPLAAALAAFVLCPVMVGATYTNFTKKRRQKGWIATFVLLVLCAWVAWGRGAGLS